MSLRLTGCKDSQESRGSQPIPFGNHIAMVAVPIGNIVRSGPTE